MDYMKHLLNKEKIKLPQQQATYAELYEMLGNQQEFKNVIKKALSTIKGLKGNVTLAQYTEGRFVITGFLGDKEFVETTFEDKEALKKVSTTKSPYFSEFEEVKFENQYIVLPILAKDEFLGALCIHDEQDVKVWDEVHLFIHFIAVVFKYYNLIDLNKDIDIKDVVTGLFNYRHFNDQLDIETEKSRRYHAPLSVLLLDVQNFKLINDRLGYDAGDDVLKQIANWLKKICRRVDMPARLDADTFGILLSNTDIGGAHVLLQRIILKIQNNHIDAGGKQFKIKITGHALGYDPDYSNEEFLKAAFEGLHSEKKKNEQ